MIGVVLALSMVASAGGVQARTPAPLSGGLGFEVDGVVLPDVELVGALRTSIEMEAVPICPGSGVCTGALWEALWDLEAIAAGVTDKAKHEIAMNSIRNMRAVAAELDVALGGGGGDLDGDGYPDLLHRKRPGRVKYGNITLKRGFVSGSTLLEWYRQAASGSTERRSGALVLRDKEDETARYNLFECWPVAYKLSFEDGALVEEIELAVERIERAALEIAIDEEGMPATQAPVRLEANGALVGRFESVTPVSGSLSWGDGGGVDQDCDGAAACSDGRDDDCDGVAACPAERPVRCADGSCTAALLAALDDLDAQVDGIAERTKHDTTKNAIGNIRALVADADGGVDGVYAPGQPHWGQVRLSRPLSSAYAAGVWFAGEAHGAVGLSYLGPDGKPLVRLDLGEAWPVGYSVRLVDGQLVEEVVVRPIRMEMK